MKEQIENIKKWLEVHPNKWAFHRTWHDPKGMEYRHGLESLLVQEDKIQYCEDLRAPGIISKHNYPIKITQFYKILDE